MKPLFRNTFLFLALLFWGKALGCDACNLKQPKITQNLVHGVGPESEWDWFLVGAVGLLTVFTLFYAVKLIFLPGEKKKDHIKYTLFHHK